MAGFNFSKVMNPVETLFTAHDKDGQNGVTFKLRPSDTGFAFDASRWQSLVRAGRLDDANELQFQLGLNRIAGWTDVTDESGTPVEFNPQTFGAFTRLVDAIPYIMRVGEKTLEELDAIPSVGNGQGLSPGVMLPQAEVMCEATVIPGPQAEA